MEEFLLVPAKEDPREVARVKGELTDNARLTYAGQLGAKKRRLLKDPSLTPDEKMVKLLPVSKALARETRRIRQFKVPDTETEEEETELLTPAMDKWMRRMVKTFGRPTGATATTPSYPLDLKKKLAALKLGILTGYTDTTPRKPPVPPKPKTLQIQTPISPSSPEPGPSWRDPGPIHAKDLVEAIKTLKPTPKGKGKGKAKSPLETAFETALKSKFASTKEEESEEDESDEEEGWLRRLRPRPTKPPKTWEEW